MSSLGALGRPAASRPGIRSLSPLGSRGVLSALPAGHEPSRDPFAESAGFAGFAGRMFAESAGFAGCAGRAHQAGRELCRDPSAESAGFATSRPGILSLSLLGSLGALGGPSRDPFAESAGFAGRAGRAGHEPSRDPFAESAGFAGFAGFAGRARQAGREPSTDPFAESAVRWARWARWAGRPRAVQGSVR